MKKLNWEEKWMKEMVWFEKRIDKNHLKRLKEFISEILIEEKVNIIKIKEVAFFDCGIYQNALNIANALCQAGRFVKIRQSGTSYFVEIYEQNNH